MAEAPICGRQSPAVDSEASAGLGEPKERVDVHAVFSQGRARTFALVASCRVTPFAQTSRGVMMQAVLNALTVAELKDLVSVRLTAEKTRSPSWLGDDVTFSFDTKDGTDPLASFWLGFLHSHIKSRG